MTQQTQQERKIQMTNKALREKIEEEIVFLSDHWDKNDTKPFSFGGWKEEVCDRLFSLFEKEMQERFVHALPEKKMKPDSKS